MLGITGSVAAYKAAELISRLKKAGHEIECIATARALDFIGTAALEGLLRHRVHTDMFESPHEISHISLAQWADLMLIYPASADTIARLRAGRAEDLLCATALALNFSAPLWIAPAMNTRMLAHPAVQENLEVLTRWGCRILPTEEGEMACGTTGSGRLLSPELVEREIARWSHEH